MAKSKGDDAPEAGLKVMPAKKLYEVSLPHSPTRRVEAEHPAAAWEAYKRSCGLIASEHQYEAKEVPAEDAAQE